MLNEDYKDMLRALCAENVRFLVIGAYALAAYGCPRATMDIDLWVMPSPSNAEAVLRALQRFGAPLHDLALPDLQRDDPTVWKKGISPDKQVRVAEMMKKVGDFIRVAGLALSVYLLLAIGTTTAIDVLHLSYPRQAAAVLAISIFIIGPASMLFVLPATILGVMLPKGSRFKKSQITRVHVRFVITPTVPPSNRDPARLSALSSQYALMDESHFGHALKSLSPRSERYAQH